MMRIGSLRSVKVPSKPTGTTFYFTVQTPRGKGVVAIRTYATGSTATKRPKRPEEPIPLFVTPQWLQENMKFGKVKVIDASWDLNKNMRDEYAVKRIPTSYHFDIDVIADTTTTDLPHMVPKPIPYEKEMEAMGLTHKDHVVIYDRSGEYIASGRVWWTMYTFGHKKVSILEGGLGAWIKANGQIETGPPPPPRPRVTYKAGRYKSRMNRDNIADMRQVNQAANGKGQIVDARSPARFNGTEPEPRPNVKSGHVPGSVNIHYKEVLTPIGAGPETKFKTKEEIEALFKSKGINPDDRIITTCGSGVTSCILALALYNAGKTKFVVYDGAWIEYQRYIK
jgi:thiosulfate/3-mercaptopyruvate sulfurtransferase